MPEPELPLTVPALVAAAADRFGARCAISTDGRSWDYTALEFERRSAAKAFLAAGIRKGDRIALWAPNCAQWIFAAIGAQSIGAVVVPVNNRLGAAEAADILRRAGVKILFTWPALEQGEPLSMLADEVFGDLQQSVLLEGDAGRALTWADFVAAGAGVADEDLRRAEAEVAPDDVADMLFTSGTTGRPKGVLSTHRQNIQVFSTWADTVGLRGDDIYLIINPFFHTFGYKAGWLASIIVGCTIVPMQAFDADLALQKIAADKVTMLPGAPSLYEMLLAHPRRGEYDLSSLRLGVTGAASVPVQLVRDMKAVLGFETVVTAYGLTESTGVVSICRPEDDPETIAKTSGRAIDGVEVQCIDPATGDALPAGKEGEIVVRGYNVMLGYFDDPEATAKAIDGEGWLHTGDIGVMDDRGYLRITDRLKDMYIMNGENVYPAEVEKALFELDGVAQIAVIGVPKTPQGEVGMAFVVRAPGAALDAGDIKAFAAQKLARYKQPYYVEFVESLPLNAAGKVVKPELKKLAESLRR